MSWRRAYATCVALVLLFHIRLVWPGRALINNDFRALFIPLRMGLQNTLKAGEWPFWQRGMFLGYPLLGDIQFQLFNPLTWLTLPLDAARGITVQSIAELCICAVGMAYWMKLRGLKPWQGVFAGCVFALSLKETVHLHHWTFASSTCAWPWMLAGVESGSIWLTALATCGTWIGGSPQMAYFGTALALLYSLTERRWRSLIAIPLGIALAAPLLLPVQELSSLGPRGMGVTYRFQSDWSWPGRQVWLSMLLPRCWGGRPDYRGPMNYWEVQGYLGLLPMALLAAVPWKKRGLIVFGIVTVLCVWFSFGSESWLGFHRLMTHLPGYGGFRNPTRALMLATFCVAVLAAEALGRLEEQGRNVLIALGVLAVVVAICVAFPQPGYWAEPLRIDGMVALALIAASTAFVLFKPRWAPLAIALFLVDVAVQTWDSPRIGIAKEEGRLLSSFEPQIPKAPAPRRVATLLDWGEGNNATFARGWEGVTGYGPTPIMRVVRLLHGTFLGVPAPARPIEGDVNFPRFRPDSPLSPLLGAPFVATDLDANLQPLAMDGDLRLYPLPALPRVYWAGSYQVASDEWLGGLLAEAADGTFAVLPEEPDFDPGKPGAARANEVEVHTNSLRADFDAPRPGLAVVLDPYFPGWSARVDGAPAPILRANFAFMAVPVKAGRHTLTLRYFPTRLLPGLFVAATALVLLQIFAMRRVDRRGVPVYFPPP